MPPRTRCTAAAAATAAMAADLQMEYGGEGVEAEDDGC